MINGLNKRELYQKSTNYTTLKCFPGATAKHLHHYLQPHLIEEAPTSVFIHGGTNDLSDYSKSPEVIADELVRAGETAKQSGTRNIFISSIIVREVGSFSTMEARRKEVNRILQERCDYANFIFVDNENILTSDLSNDRVHLRRNGPGSVKFLSNIVRALNNRPS